MKEPYLSIIIPTYNRRAKLEESLRRVRAQNFNAEAFEVIVVNDGSTDDTAEFLDSIAPEWEHLTVIHQKNSGQGIARNQAIQAAKGQVILFIQDDIYITEGFLKQHVDFHQDHPEVHFGCLGLTEWYPEKKVNLFMEWLTNGGPQFAYHKLTPHQEASFYFFYTSNISLKRELLAQHYFDTDFKGYGWEDIELGYRLHKEGFKLIYNPNALAYHDHFMDASSLEKKMRAIGKNAHVFQKKHPELNLMPHPLKRAVFQILGSPLVILPLKIMQILSPSHFARYYWYALSKRYFLKGLRRV